MIIYPAYGTVAQLDDRLGDILPDSAAMQLLASGFEWSEGPLWIADGGYLLFSDIPRNAVMRWAPGDTVAQVYLQPSGYTGEAPFGGTEPGSNALLLDPQGQLVLCQHGDRRMARMTAPMAQPTAQYETIVGSYDGKLLNSPNDAIYHSNGNLYFTDPPYGLPGGADSDAKMLDFQGVYRYSERDATLTLLTDALTRPNGLAFTPDEAQLIVANSNPDRAVWMSYTLQPDGTLGTGRVYYDATEQVANNKGLPDGMAMHSSGHLFATGPGGVYVFAPDQSLLGVLRTGQATANCTFDDTESHLYITADSLLLRLPMR